MIIELFHCSIYATGNFSVEGRGGLGGWISWVCGGEEWCGIVRRADMERRMRMGGRG